MLPWNASSPFEWAASTWAAVTGSLPVYVGGSSPSAVTRPSHDGMNAVSSWPPLAVMSRYVSAAGTIGKIALSPGGCWAAVKIWLMAP